MMVVRLTTSVASITGSVSSTALTLEVVENKLLDSSNSGTDKAENTAQVMHPSTSPGCYCHHHKSTTHNTDDCKVLKSAEQQGKGKKAKKGKDAKVPKKEQANSANDSDSDSSECAHVATVSSGIYKKISAYIARDSTSTRSSVLIDSGASCTTTYDTRFFETLPAVYASACDASAIGTMRLSCKTSQGPVDLAIHGALLVPDFTCWSQTSQ